MEVDLKNKITIVSQGIAKSTDIKDSNGDFIDMVLNVSLRIDANGPNGAMMTIVNQNTECAYGVCKDLPIKVVEGTVECLNAQISLDDKNMALLEELRERPIKEE